MRKNLLVIMLIGCSFSVFADAYRCKEGGKVVITNTPCETGKVVRSDNPPSESVSQAQMDLERQRGYLDTRYAEQKEDRRSLQRHAEEVDRMYPNRPEPVAPSSSGITFRGCGLGGSCSTSRTTTR